MDGDIIKSNAKSRQKVPINRNASSNYFCSHILQVLSFYFTSLSNSGQCVGYAVLAKTAIYAADYQKQPRTPFTLSPSNALSNSPPAADTHVNRINIFLNPFIVFVTIYLKLET